jgi:hypothetical protein
MSHKEIVAFLVENYQVGAWWQQMVTVTYEQARGRRDKQEANQRSRWLPDPAFTIRRQTQNKSLRAVWVDGQTNLDVDFYDKGPARTQVTVQHSRLADTDQAEAMKAYWAEALNRLDEFLKG